MSDAYIIDATRTPWGKYGGALRDHNAASLAATCLRELMRRHDLAADSLDAVILGQVLQGGAGVHPARQALVAAGISDRTPATLVNKVCGSSLRAVVLAAQQIQLGDASLIAAGGMESMTNAPYYDFHTRWGARKGDVTLVDGVLHDGLVCSFHGCHLAVHSDHSATCHGVSRAEMDALALESQHRWGKADAAGWFAREIIPVPSVRNAEHTVLERDENPRPDSTMRVLSRMAPVLETEAITPGNSPAINDGAAALLVASGARAAQLDATPIARIAGSVEVAVAPRDFSQASAEAIRRLTQKTGVALDDVEILEINEAFAAVPLICARELGVDLSRANRHGGAVAMGHPIGATGGRLVMTAALQMQHYGARYAIASICSGAGQGDAILLEAVR